MKMGGVTLNLQPASLLNALSLKGFLGFWSIQDDSTKNLELN